MVAETLIILDLKSKEFKNKNNKTAAVSVVQCAEGI